MKDPVFASDGNTYERCSIEQWFSKEVGTSLTTNARLENLTLIPNHLARRLITALLEERGGVARPNQNIFNPSFPRGGIKKGLYRR